MDCAQLADMLKQVITDKKYQSDLTKLIGKFFCESSTAITVTNLTDN